MTSVSMWAVSKNRGKKLYPGSYLSLLLHKFIVAQLRLADPSPVEDLPAVLTTDLGKRISLPFPAYP